MDLFLLVVGNSRTRAVSTNLAAARCGHPAPDGVWPLVINDETVVERLRAASRTWSARGDGAAGRAARITMRLAEIPDGCRVQMIEVPIQGPISLIPDRVALMAIRPRNRECLWRLGALRNAWSRAR